MKSIYFTDMTGKDWMEVDMLIDLNNNKKNTNIFQEGFHQRITCLSLETMKLILLQ
jgi:hypothetical protein